MFTKAAFLFLLGTTLSSGQYWPLNAPHGITFTPYSKSSGCPSGPELAPLICKFMQQNIGLQFKPQLIAPSTYIAPLVVEKCDTPKLQTEIELPPPTEEMKPLVIPEPPQLPPMTIPKFPVPVIIQEPPAALNEPCESADIQEMPIVTIPTTPELPPQEIQVVPQPPELPTFVIPELPKLVVEPESPTPAAPCPEDEPSPAPVYIEQLATIPAAPELPVFVMPEIPIQVVEHESIMPAAPCVEDEPVPAPTPAYVEPLAPLPAAPELPAFVMPEIPTQVEQESPMPNAPTLETEPIPFVPIPAYRQPLPEFYYNMIDYQPMFVPQPPELPAILRPELPVIMNEPIPANFEPSAPIPAAPELPAAPLPIIVEQPLQEPCLNDKNVAEIEYNTVEYQPVAVPQPPELPELAIPDFSVRIVEQNSPLAVTPHIEDQLASIVTVPEQIQPLAPIPAAPELPPVNLPELPVHVQFQPEQLPTFIAQPEPCLTEEKVVTEPIIIPQPPKLPEVKMPELPIEMPIVEQAPCEPSLSLPSPFYQKMFPSLITIYNEKAKETQNILLPNHSIGSDGLPTPCVYNLVMKHVLPNIASNNFRSMENVEIQPASFIPCA